MKNVFMGKTIKVDYIFSKRKFRGCRMTTVILKSNIVEIKSVDKTVFGVLQYSKG